MFSGISKKGQYREENQDTMVLGDSFVVLADGMGGYKNGRQASTLACKLAEEKIQNSTTIDQYSLVQMIHEINEEIYKWNLLQDDGPAGTTLLIAYIDELNGLLNIAWVGDTLGYVLEGQSVQQLIRPDRLVQNLVDSGVITEDQAKNHEMGHALSQAIGHKDVVSPNYSVHEIQKGQRFLFCSDGVYEYVDLNSTIPTLIQNSDSEWLKILENLCFEKSHDNYTLAISKKFDALPGKTTLILDSAQESPKKASVKTAVALPLILLVFLMAVYLLKGAL